MLFIEDLMSFTDHQDNPSHIASYSHEVEDKTEQKGKGVVMAKSKREIDIADPSTLRLHDNILRSRFGDFY